MSEYIYEKTDKESIKKHKEAQMEIPIYFHISCYEKCIVEAWSRVLKMIEDGKTTREIKDYLAIRVQSILAD